MHFFIGILILILAVLSIAILSLIHFLHRGWRILSRTMRGDYTDEEVERLSRKNFRQQDKDRFSNDYFKKASSKQASAAAGNAGAGRQTVSSSEGMTITYDESKARQKRKIFSEDEGEYVDFTEN